MPRRKNRKGKYGTTTDTRKHPSKAELDVRYEELRRSSAPDPHTQQARHLWISPRDEYDERILELLAEEGRVQTFRPRDEPPAYKIVVKEEASLQT